MTHDEKKSATNAAWAQYRAKSIALPRTLSFSDFVTADDRLWRLYLKAEHDIANAKP